MKGGVACFVAAALDHLAARGGAPNGSLSFLITGDEEGIAVNGTVKLLQWAAERGERFDHCILGEPTNPAGARRHHQDRPARLAQRRAGGDRQAGPRRLSAACRQSGARPGQADERADGRAARPRQRAFRPVESRIHLDRHRQPRRSTSSPARRARASTSASTTRTRARRSRRWSSSAPHAAAGNSVRWRIDWEPSNADVFLHPARARSSTSSPARSPR